MVKSARKRLTTSRAAKSKKHSNNRKKEKKSKQQQARSGTKQSNAIEMLRSHTGASIEALMKVTGWQQHSVRGFLTGVVRKRFQLNLESALKDGVRIYRITGEPAGTSLKPHVARTKS
jgi:hypothetical protein